MAEVEKYLIETKMDPYQRLIICWLQVQVESLQRYIAAHVRPPEKP